MRTRVIRWATLAAGWFFIALGIAGLFLPVLQGVLFIVIGLVILSSEYVWAHRLIAKLKERFPVAGEPAHKLAHTVHSWLQSFSKTRLQEAPPPSPPSLKQDDPR